MLLKKTATIKRFQYSLIESKLKKQTGIAKDQYKFFKDQINVINNKREDGVKTEVGVKTEDREINVHNKYIDNKYTILINGFFTHGLKDEDLHLTNFDNRIGLKVLPIDI